MEKGGKTTKNSKKTSGNPDKFVLPVKVKRTTKTKLIKKKVAPIEKTKEEPAQATIEEISPREKELVSQILSKKEENYKMKIMYAGVSFFMIVIIFFWAYNTRNIIKQTRIAEDSQRSTEKWGDFAEEFSTKMEEIKNNLNDINSFGTTSPSTDINEPLPTASSTEILNIDDSQISTTTSTSTESKVSQEEIEELKEKIKELENKIED